MTQEPVLSIVMATYNRRDVTLATLGRLGSLDIPASHLEMIVIDNDSSDGTADAIAERFADVKLIRSGENLGACAKALGLEYCSAPLTLFVDDDSFPRPGSIERMIEHFRSDPLLGCAGFRIHLPDGTEESAALPDLYVGCGVGFRTEVLRQVGGLDRKLFMQAEEYHLAARILNGGWKIQLFDDLHVDHLKTTTARQSTRTLYYDIRNNLLFAARYLPEPWDKIYQEDSIHRYSIMAGESQERQEAFERGRDEGLEQGKQDRHAYDSERLRPEVVETMFRYHEVEQHMAGLRGAGYQRIAFYDFGKNIYAFCHGAFENGISICGIADERFEGRAYRGIPILPMSVMLDDPPDAFVISNMSPAVAERSRQALASVTDVPIFDWYSQSHRLVERDVPASHRS